MIADRRPSFCLQLLYIQNKNDEPKLIILHFKILKDIKELQVRGAVAGVFPGQVGTGYSATAPSAQPEMKAQ